MSVGARKMFNILVIILVMSHLVASFWYDFFIILHISKKKKYRYFVARLADFDHETWVIRFHYLDNNYFSKYIASYYWSFQTITTVGYGDVPAISL
jgi:hypothetical protein